MIFYFLFIAKRFASIMSTDLSVIFLYMFFKPILKCVCFFTCHTHLWFPELHLRHLCLISFYILLSSWSSSTFNLNSLFTSMTYSELSFILWTPHVHVHILLYYYVCFLNNTIFFVIFYLIFCAAFKTIWFTYFTNVIVYFISISDNFATIILWDLSVLFLGKFVQSFLLQIFYYIMPMYIYLELIFHFNGFFSVHFHSV